MNKYIFKSWAQRKKPRMMMIQHKNFRGYIERNVNKKELHHLNYFVKKSSKP
jgi:hypothetical protein